MNLEVNKFERPYEVGRVKIVQDFITDGHERRALDIGCGPGFFSMMLCKQGWKTTSIDADSRNVESVRKCCAAEAILGDAVQVLSQLPSATYEFALALEIIEHMPKPQGEALLKHIKRLLKVGGRLLLSTPNRFSLEGLGDYYWGEKLRRGPKWNAWDETHIYIYSSFEIIHLLKLSGFSMCQIIGYWYEGRLPIIGRWRLPLKEARSFPFNRVGFKSICECIRSS